MTYVYQSLLFVIAGLVGITASPSLNAQPSKDTLASQPAERIGTLKTLDTLFGMGFQLKFSSDIPGCKVRYFYNPNSDQGIQGLMSHAGVLGVFIRDQWQLYRDYYLRIDSVYTRDMNGLGSPELVLRSSEELNNYLPVSRYGWEANETKLMILDLDSDYLLLDETFASYNREYYIEQEELDFELHCSSRVEIHDGELLISDYQYQFDGDESKVDKESQVCYCPRNGRYVLKGNRFILANP